MFISVAFSPTGKMLVSAGFDESIVGTPQPGECSADLREVRKRTGVTALSHDGKSLAAGVAGTQVRLWDVASGKATTILQTAAASWNGINTWSMDFSPGENSWRWAR